MACEKDEKRERAKSRKEWLKVSESMQSPKRKPGPTNKRPTARELKGKLNEIKTRYRWNSAALRHGRALDKLGPRIRDLRRLLHYRLERSQVPDRRLAWFVHGRELTKIIICHLVNVKYARQRIERFLAHYPWLTQAEMDCILAMPRRWKAGDLGLLLGVTSFERKHLRLTTIRAVGTTTDRELKQAKRERNALARKIKRIRKGSKPRSRHVIRSTLRRSRYSSASGSRCRSTSRRAVRWRCLRNGYRSPRRTRSGRRAPSR
jgi:hypothetical protein